MGSPIASRLTANFRVRAFDLDEERLRQHEDLEHADGVEDLARSSEVICLCLPTGSASRYAVDEICSTNPRRARVIVEMSTIGPGLLKESAVRAAEAGMNLVDAPVSGGVRNAAAGRLSVMASGAPEAIELVRPILDRVATQVFVMGDQPGLGQVMKLTNNIIALSVLPITSEALAFGSAHGLSTEQMIDVINASSGRTQRSEVVFPNSIIPETYDHGATGEIVKKDVGLFVEAAKQSGSSTRVAEVVDRLYDDFIRDHPTTDYSYVHKYIEENPSEK